MKKSDTIETYVARLAQELEDEFQRLGPDTVCAFIAETVSGAVSFPNLVRPAFSPPLPLLSTLQCSIAYNHSLLC